jgi:quercetin dioxygenase-like cupin family protein
MWTVSVAMFLTAYLAVNFYVMGRERPMKRLNLVTDIGVGTDKEVTPLFDGDRRKIIQITLRNKAILDSHKAAEPITIHCVAGNGLLIVGEEKDEVELKDGVLVTIEPNVVHEIRAVTEVSVLLTKFKEK